MRGRAWVACSFIPNPSVTSGAPTRVLFSFFFVEFGPVMPGLDPVLFFTPWQIFLLLVIVIRLSGICSISSETFILSLPHFSLCLSVLLWVSWSSLPEEILHWIPDMLCSCGKKNYFHLPETHLPPHPLPLSLLPTQITPWYFFLSPPSVLKRLKYELTEQYWCQLWPKPIFLFSGRSLLLFSEQTLAWDSPNSRLCPCWSEFL